MIIKFMWNFRTRRLQTHTYFLGNIRTKVVCIVLTTWNSNRAILAYRECNFSSSTIRAGLSVHFDWGKSCAVLWRLMRTMQRSIYHGAHRHTNTHIRWVRAWLYGLWLIHIRKYPVLMSKSYISDWGNGRWRWWLMCAFKFGSACIDDDGCVQFRPFCTMTESHSVVYELVRPTLIWWSPTNANTHFHQRWLQCRCVHCDITGFCCSAESGSMANGKRQQLSGDVHNMHCMAATCGAILTFAISLSPAYFHNDKNGVS